MSVFDGDNQNAIVNEGTDTPTEGILDQLVGEGKKFKTIEDLAKGKHESDNYIANLERQLEEMRGELDTQSKFDELLTEIRNSKTKGSTANGSDDPANAGGRNSAGNTNQTLSEDAINSLVDQRLTALEQQRTATQNVTEANRLLEGKFGDRAKEVVEAQAGALGLSMARMKELAAESPSAFMALMGAGREESPRSPTASSSVRSEAPSLNPNSNQDRNEAYYNELRRTDKRKYFSPQVQRQMMKDAERLGDKFFLNKN